MYGQEKKKGRRSAALFMDFVHIIIGALVVVLAVLTFVNPEQNKMLLPAIFALAAALNLFNGVHKFRRSGRDGKAKAAAAAQLFLAFLLIGITIVSAVSIWR